MPTDATPGERGLVTIELQGVQDAEAARLLADLRAGLGQLLPGVELKSAQPNAERMGGPAEHFVELMVFYYMIKPTVDYVFQFAKQKGLRSGLIGLRSAPGNPEAINKEIDRGQNLLKSV